MARAYHGCMPWPEDTLTADETIITSFRPHWKLLFVPIGWFLLLSIGLALILKWVPLGSFGWVLWVIYLGLAVWLVVQPLLTWWTSLYVLTSERLMTRRGLISKSGIKATTDFNSVRSSLVYEDRITRKRLEPSGESKA